MSNIPNIRKSTALAKAQILTGGLKDLLDGGFIYIYAGTEPDSPDDGVGSAVLLAKLFSNHPTDTIGLIWDTNADNGIMKKPVGATWSCTAETTGLPADASFWRWSMGADDNSGAADPDTGYRLQGRCGTDASASILLPNLTFTPGMSFSLDAFNYVVPAG